MATVGQAACGGDSGEDGKVGEGDETARDAETEQEIEVTGAGDASHDATLTAAILRIGASLDLDTVLQEVVESAQALTGAAYGVITTVDEVGAPRDFVTSGLTETQHQAIEDWPDGPPLFGYLGGLAAPLRLADLDAWVRSVGLSTLPIPCEAFQATPMRHQGTVVGSFFLGSKEGGFTDADEAMLVLFAQQAASALANARAHHEEQRIRADLEALVETSPMGVVVLDAASAALLSVNRKARHILAGLNTKETPLEQLNEIVVCRRGDGHEVRLSDLCNAETVRAEEVEISVPDGKSVRTLIDATPIASAEGTVERVVVTLQDLAPFETLERSRAEFLELVSHELRAPLAAIRGSASTALEDPREPSQDELRQYLRIVEEQAGRMSGLIGDLLDAGRIGTGTLSVNPAPAELADIVEQARTAFTSGGGQHAVTIEAPEGLRVIADGRRIVQVLSNLLENAARHSLETAPIRVSATREGEEVALSVTDGGEGIPPERLTHLFRRHAGTDGGSGLGLVICKGLVEAHGGRIRAESAGIGRGTTVTFTLPAAEEEDVVRPAWARRRRERTSVLVVDDDPHALRLAREALAAAGYDPAVTAEPGNIPRLLETKRPALAVLDLVLPGADGIELMRTLPGLAHLPVIFVSAYGEGDTVARALEAGAADYIVKPFSAAELAARVALALRRQSPPAPFRIGELAFDRAKRRVTLAGRALRLTATEYRLLHALSLDAGGVATYETLMRRIWGEKGGGNMEALRSAVAKLRRKLGDDAKKPRYVIGERGLGYRMPEPDGP